jgi:CelD/BcsL family acetyltransferase involved in cellulose biosynthesis
VPPDFNDDVSATFARLDPADPRWLEYIASDPASMIYHHPAWIATIVRCYGFGATVAAMLDERGRVLAGIPLIDQRSLLLGRRLVGLPFSDFCPPLARDPGSLSALLAALAALGRAEGVRGVEIRWPLPGREGMYAGEPMLRHTTPLTPDTGDLFARLHRTRVQQPIRTASEHRVEVRRGGSWDDLATYYGLHVRTRRRLGAPPQPVRFFRLLREEVLDRGLGFLLLAHAGGRPVAGGIFLIWGDTVVYKFNASDPVYWNVAPNHALLWEAMRWGGSEGYHLFDWGKTELGHHGLRDFKRGWGSREEVLNVSIIADEPPAVGGRGSARALMGYMLRRSPLWLCRAVGELVYGQLG